MDGITTTNAIAKTTGLAVRGLLVEHPSKADVRHSVRGHFSYSEYSYSSIHTGTFLFYLVL